MIVNDYYQNLDRVLGIIYAYQDPISILQSLRNSNNRDLTSNPIFRFQLTSLHSTKDGIRDSSLRGVILREYRSHYPNDFSSDQVELQLDQLDKMLANLDPDQHDSSFLFNIAASQVLSQNNSLLEVNFDKLFDWNGYINKVDMSYFISAYVAANPSAQGMKLSEPYYPIVSNQNLRWQLTKIGCADNHAHLNASGYITELNWLGFLNTTKKKPLSEFLHKGGLGRLRDSHSGEELLYFLRVTQYLRALLSTYLEEHHQYYDSMCSQSDKDLVDEQNRMFHAILTCRDLQQLDQKGMLIRQQYRQRFKEEFSLNKATNISKVLCYERSFLVSCFKSLNGKNRQNTRYKLLFNLYLCFSNQIKLCFIQTNEGYGFDRFKDAEILQNHFFDSKSPTRRSLNYQSVFKRYLDTNVRKVEFRLAPKKSVDAYNKLIQDLNDARNAVVERSHDDTQIDGHKHIDYGLIVHFIKDKPTLISSQVSQVSRRRMYRKYRMLLRSDATALRGFLMTSKLRKTIVGIDTANFEQENPPEIFVPLFRQFEEIKQQQNFHFTYHVGESFNSLIDGLRHIYEVIFRLGFTSGDRLGHALALGMNVTDYYSHQRGLLLTTRQSFLDDLIWLYLMLLSQNTDPADGYLNYIETLFNNEVRWYENICHQSIKINDYLDFYLMRGLDLDDIITTIYSIADPCNGGYKLPSYCHIDAVAIASDPRYKDLDDSLQRAILNPTAVKLYWHYEWNPQLMISGKESVSVILSKQLLETIVRAQKLLQLQIRAEGIAIEANPSSNRKISLGKNYAQLPFLNLNRHGLVDNTTPDLKLSINTDDSSLFQTTLPYEYSLIALALIRDGNSNEDVCEYIGYLQRSSMQQSFVKDVSHN